MIGSVSQWLRSAVIRVVIAGVSHAPCRPALGVVSADAVEMACAATLAMVCVVAAAVLMWFPVHAASSPACAVVLCMVARPLCRASAQVIRRGVMRALWRGPGAVGWGGFLVAASLVCWAASCEGPKGHMGRMGQATVGTVALAIRRQCFRTCPMSRPWPTSGLVRSSVAGRVAGRVPQVTGRRLPAGERRWGRRFLAVHQPAMRLSHSG